MQMTQSIGQRIRKHRRRLGLTLNELATRTGISKPYLSLIETNRVPNPPSDEKLRRIEQTLGFFTGELLTHAHLQRTPQDVRAILGKLLSQRRAKVTRAVAERAPATIGAVATDEGQGRSYEGASHPHMDEDSRDDFDMAYVSSLLREWVNE
jgi:transcriptional regulator with XRE-family HTH domain